jgi:hypothetical protein
MHKGIFVRLITPTWGDKEAGSAEWPKLPFVPLRPSQKLPLPPPFNTTFVDNLFLPLSGLF